MTLLRSLAARAFPLSALMLLAALAAPAQTAPVLPRVTQPVDPGSVVTLRGNTHPLARPEFDQGAAPDGMALHRMLLVLQRSPQQETALRQLLDDQQTKVSPNYHMWLTPEQFGEQFGPVPSDVQAVTGWLASQGFEVNRVAAGRTVIEFSGPAGALRQAFHTEMHKYLVNGEERWANAGDPQIPAALAPVVGGFASLNNFPRRPLVQRLGAFSRSKGSAQARPLFTITGSNKQTFYAVGATDFATIYNVLPLWQASPAIDGTGQTIAIVGQTNIDLQDPHGFREIFLLPINDPTVILDGPDPGITEDETEADLNVEWSGAVAAGATIDLVVSASTETTAGIDLSALYIIDNNLAPVMSESYGYCEQFLGTGGNAFYSTTREQGAAQGITIINSAGDAGSARCDQSDTEAAAQYGLAVSGLASTPFNTAVGGTDFNDEGSWTTYWSPTNAATTFSSALSYIPESTWNNSCARFGATSCATAATDTPTGVDHTAGGGGVSNCATSSGSGSSVTCTAGYPKPAWQSGSGVPSDGARDIPDVALFASNGTNDSFYVLCQADALPQGSVSCNSNASTWYFMGAGGTSAAAPAFAGIMALVNQKTGERQGNANYVLYSLAAQNGASCTSNAAMSAGANGSSCVFYDVVTGNNSVACVAGSPNCGTATLNGFGILEVDPPANTTPAWTSGPGYDLATGLGSVNAANLVKDWTSVSFAPTTTTLASLSPTTVTHGQPVNFTINVAPGSGTGTPAGDVSLVAQTGSSLSGVPALGAFTLHNGNFSGSTNMLPGGIYGVTAHYAGNGTFAASDSTPPVMVTVNPEGSATRVSMVTFDFLSGLETSSNATFFQYGSAVPLLRVDVTNGSGQLCTSGAYPCPAGQVSLTDNGLRLDLGTYTLNSEGYAEDQLPSLISGVNNLVATYSGGSSYNPSTSQTDTVTFNPAPTTTTMTGVPATTVANTVTQFSANVATQSRGVAPSGIVGVVNGNNSYPNLWEYPTPTNGSATGYASLSEFISYQFSQPGPATFAVEYMGDNNYAASTSAPATLTVTDFSISASPSAVTVSAPGQSATAALTVTPLYGQTGLVGFNCNSESIPGTNCRFSVDGVNLGSQPVSTVLTLTTTAAVSSTPDSAPRHRAQKKLSAVSPQGGESNGSGQAGAGRALPLRASSLTTLSAAKSRFRLATGFHLPAGWGWTLIGVLGLMVFLTRPRWRLVYLPIALALLVAGILVACGGGGGGGGSLVSTPEPAVSLSSNLITFNNQSVGAGSSAQFINLVNSGDASLTVSGVTLAGTNPGDFAQTNTCAGSAISAGAKCTISVTFTPTAMGTRSAALSIADDAGGSPQVVYLNGTGTSQITLTPSSLNFGAENAGSTSAPQNVTVANGGNTTVNISSISTAPEYFNETDNCGSSLPPGSSCTVAVTFSPVLVVGVTTAQLEVVDNAAGSPQIVTLSGTAVTAATPPGNYAIQVEGSIGNDRHTINIPVTVQ